MSLSNALEPPSLCAAELASAADPCTVGQASRKRSRQVDSAAQALESCISPCTPDSTSESPPSLTRSPVTPVADSEVAWLSSAFVLLADWLQAVQGLHPICKLIPSETALLALGVFRKYAAATGLGPQHAVLQPLNTQTAAAASLWVAIKFLAMPSCVPNSKFLYRVTGVHPQLLVKFEPIMLRAVNWDLLDICKGLNLWKPQAVDEPKTGFSQE